MFLDIESLRSGHFNTQLYNVIDNCKDFVMILSPHALDRCVNEGDWVANELTHAITKNTNVIPFITRGFHWPENLPSALASFPFFEGIEASSEYFDASMERLERLLLSEKTISKSQKSSSRQSSDDDPHTIIEDICACLIDTKLALEHKDKQTFMDTVPKTEEKLMLLKMATAHLKFSDKDTYNTAEKINQMWKEFSEDHMDGEQIDAMFDTSADTAIEDLSDIIDLLLLETAPDRKQRKEFLAAADKIRSDFKNRSAAIKRTGRIPLYLALLILTCFLAGWIAFSAMGWIKFGFWKVVLAILLILVILVAMLFFSMIGDVHLRSSKNLMELYSVEKSLETMQAEVQAVYEQTLDTAKRKLRPSMRTAFIFCLLFAFCAAFLLYRARCG